MPRQHVSPERSRVSTTPVQNLRVPQRCAEPHPLGAAPRRLGSQRFFPACPGRPLPSAQQVPAYSYPPRPPQAENSQHEPTSTSVPPAKSTTAVDPTGLRRHSEMRIAHDHAPSAARATQRPHHARNVSISRSTCIDSARSDSSAASLSASARIAAPAFLRAASIRAARTTADTGEPSSVKTSSALDVSSSGRKVIVSAIRNSVRHSVRHIEFPERSRLTYTGKQQVDERLAKLNSFRPIRHPSATQSGMPPSESAKSTLLSRAQPDRIPRVGPWTLTEGAQGGRSEVVETRSPVRVRH